MSGTLENPARTVGDERRHRDGDERLRLLLLSRRLWPLAGEAEISTLQLAQRMQDLGAEPTLVTARWQPNWAEHSTLRGIPLVRLPMPTTPGWRMIRYLYALTRYLRKVRQQLNAVVVSGMRAEAYCALSCLQGSGIPVILQVNECGPHGEIAWQRTTRFGGRIAAKCQQATAFLVANSFIRDELMAAGYPRERIHIRPPVVCGDEGPRHEESRQAARSALAGVNHDLHVVGGAPVALCISPLQRERGLETLIRAWSPIQQRWPQARLWIIGDGAEREALFQLICNLDCRYRIVIPGAFDHWDDLFRAADFLVAPAPTPGNCVVLQEAFASGLPVIAADQPEHRLHIEPEKSGLLFEPANKGLLTHCLTRLIDNVELRARLSAAARDLHREQPRNDASLWLRDFIAAQRRS